MRTPMFIKMNSLRERPLTTRTVIRFVMRTYMILQHILPTECLPTEHTTERSLPRVCSLVILQRSLPRERLLTIRAMEGFLTTVHAEVNAKVRSRRELGTTHRTCVFLC